MGTANLSASFVISRDSASGQEKSIDDWQKWQSILWTDPSLGEKVVAHLVHKSKRDPKKFEVEYGSPKSASTLKFLANSEKERDLWVRAIQQMVVYHLRMGFLQDKYTHLFDLPKPVSAKKQQPGSSQANASQSTVGATDGKAEAIESDDALNNPASKKNAGRFKSIGSYVGGGKQQIQH